MNTSAPADHPAVARLCPACGLCCNGALFKDVVLQPADNPQQLAALGLTLRKTARRIAFHQPCSCFDGSLCRIYANRPSRCRSFACGLLLRVQSGEVSEATALSLISGAREKADLIRSHLRQLGDRQEHLPLGRRYARVMAAPIDLAGHERLTRLRSRLARDMDRFMRLLQKHFLNLPEPRDAEMQSGHPGRFQHSQSSSLTNSSRGSGTGSP